MSDLNIFGKIDPNWRETKYRNFDRGHYQHVPWLNYFREINDHFVHVSLKNPAMVAYTPNESAGERGRVVEMKPGRYLTKYYATRLTPEEINKYATMMLPSQLFITNSPEEVKKIYMSGPQSCMSVDFETRYKYDIHPVEVYLSGDLALAYIKNGYEIIARALVWPEKKIHGQIYGDMYRMKNTLAASGFTAAPFEGAKIKKVLHKKNEKPNSDEPNLIRYVMPYIDGEANRIKHYSDEHFIITKEIENSFDSGSSEGITDTILECKCKKLTQNYFSFFKTFEKRDFICKDCFDKITDKFICSYDGNYYCSKNNKVEKAYHSRDEYNLVHANNLSSFTKVCSVSGKNVVNNAVVRIGGTKEIYIAEFEIDKSKYYRCGLLNTCFAVEIPFVIYNNQHYNREALLTRGHKNIVRNYDRKMAAKEANLAKQAEKIDPVKETA